MKGLLALAGVLLAYTSQAQDTSLPTQQQIVNQLGKDGYNGVVQTYDTRYQGIQGTPFLHSDWLQGELEYADGRVYENVPMKYDMYKDELWVKNQIQQEVIVFHHHIRRFAMRSPESDTPLLFEKAHYIKGLEDFVQPELMVQVLHEDGFKVVAVRQKVLKKANYKGAYSSEQYQDEFKEVDPVYYYIAGDQQAKKFKSRKRSVLKVFPAQTDDLEAFIREHQLDLADPKDMGRLLSYYEETIANEH